MATRRDALWAAVCAAPDDDLPRLVYADWLDEHGDPQLAQYIRVRCALDGHPLTADTLADSQEQFLEADAGMWRRKDVRQLPAGFSVTGITDDITELWADENDGMARGLPACASIDRGSRTDEAEVAAAVIRWLPDLLRRTPVRGLDFEWYARGHLGTILTHPVARPLRHVRFSSRPVPGEPCPDVAALCGSPVAPDLLRLHIDESVKSAADVDALTAAPFGRLRRLDELTIGLPEMVTKVMAAPWFRGLADFSTRFGKGCGEPGVIALGGMPNLHTLRVWHPTGATVRALPRAAELPALSRLCLGGAGVPGEFGAALGGLRAPRLAELWLRLCKLNDADLRALAESPLLDNVRVLTFDSTSLGGDGLKALAARPWAANLRILRVKYAELRALANTPLSRPGAFPALTTLVLETPGGKGGNGGRCSGTAALLSKLATPNLRHLTLDTCGFDDDCAAALATNPVFAGLTRLMIREGTVSAGAAKKLFRSRSLQHLVELKVANCPIKDGAVALTDPDVMAGLTGGGFDWCNVPAATVTKLREVRPGMSLEWAARWHA